MQLDDPSVALNEPEGTRARSGAHAGVSVCSDGPSRHVRGALGGDRATCHLAPAAHAAQPLIPGLAANSPWLHEKHLMLEVNGEYDPESQAKQEPPAVCHREPIGQSEHSGSPWARCVPGRQ